MAEQRVENRCLQLEAISRDASELRKILKKFADDHKIDKLSLDYEEHIELVQNAKRIRLLVILLLHIAEYTDQYAVVAAEFFGKNPRSIIQEGVNRNQSIASHDLDTAQAKLAELLKQKANSNYGILEILGELMNAGETYGSKNQKDDPRLRKLQAIASHLCLSFSSEEKFSPGEFNEVKDGKINSSGTLLSNVVWLMKQYEIYLTSLAMERTREAIEPHLEKPDADEEGADQNLIDALDSLAKEVTAITNGNETKATIMTRVTKIVNELEPWKDTDWRKQFLSLTERLIDQRDLLNGHIEQANTMRGQRIDSAND